MTLDTDHRAAIEWAEDNLPRVNDRVPLDELYATAEDRVVAVRALGGDHRFAILWDGQQAYVQRVMAEKPGPRVGRLAVRGWSHAMLYVTEYTAPDGSKRRPIVERVPGLLPSGLGVKTDGMFTGMWSEVIDEDESSRNGRQISERGAAALLRCAVMSWLANHRVWADSNMEPVDADRVACTLLDQVPDEAVVAVAHLVADVKGIEP